MAILAAGLYWIFLSPAPLGFGFLEAMFGHGLAVGVHFAGNIRYMFLSVVAACLLLLSCQLAGLRIIDFLSLDSRDNVLSLLALFIGYAVLSLALLGAAALGLWHRPVLLAVAALPLADLRKLSRLAGGFFLSCRAVLGRPKMAAWLGAGAVVVLLVSATPEVYEDCFWYSLAYVQQIMLTKRLFSSLVRIDFLFPCGADFPNAIPLVFGLDAAAKLVHPALCLAGVSALVMATGIAGIGLLKWLIVPVAFLVPSARSWMFTAKNEAVVLGGFCMLIALMVKAIDVSGPGRKRMLLPIGIMAGFLFSSKYTILPSIMVMTAVLFMALGRINRWNYIWLFISGFLASGSWWAFRSWVYTADPAYPIFTVFGPWAGGDPSGAGQVRWAYSAMGGESGGFVRAVYDAGRFLAANAFPAIACALVWPSTASKGSSTVIWGLFGSALCTCLAVHAPMQFLERYLFPVSAALNAVVLSGMSASAVKNQRISGRVITALMGILYIACCWRILQDRAGDKRAEPPSAFFRGFKSAEKYRNKSMDAYGAFLDEMAVNGRISAALRGKILSVENSIGGGLFSWGLPGRALGQGFEPSFLWKTFNECSAPGRAEVRFRQAGISSIMFCPTMNDWSRLTARPSPCRWTPGMLRLYHQFAADHFRMELYALNYDPPIATMCLYSYQRKSAGGSKRMLYLPGIEYEAWGITGAIRAGKYKEAIELTNKLESLLPGVAWIEKLKIEVLGSAGRAGEARRMVERLGREDARGFSPATVVLWGGASGGLK